MKAELVALLRPEIKTDVGGRVTYYNLEPLEEELSADSDFIEKLRACRFDWPGEAVPVSALAYWLLQETERSGDAERALAKLNDFLAAPRSTWQYAIVCTNVPVQNKGVGEGWEFCNGVVAYAAGLPPEYMILSDDGLVGKGLIFLDLKKGRDCSDLVGRVTDCCRSLNFIAGEGCFLRPSYYTHVYEKAAPFPLGSVKGWLSSRRNQYLTLITEEMIQRANNLLEKMQNVAEDDLPTLRRVLDRHAGAVAWGDIDNRAIEARVCMEMMLMSGSRGDNTFKVSRRAAYLMADDLDQRKKRMKQAKGLYDAGSTVVHEGTLKKEDHIDAVRNCHQFLDDLVTAWLERNARKITDDDWAVVELGGGFPD